MSQLVPHMRKVANVIAYISTAAAILFVILSFFITSPLPQACQMSYSKPRYARTMLPYSPTMSRLPKQYALFTYTDGFARYTMSKVTDSLTIIAFFPGNVGSYKQIRSIASRIIRKVPEGLLRDAIEHYTFDFGEESSALSALSLTSQAEYAADTISALVNSRTKSLNIDRSVVSIILIGHSMGGSVASALFTRPAFPSDLVSAMYILGSPIRAPVLTTEFALHDFYQDLRQFWNLQTTHNVLGLQSMLCVSISGGTNDLLVESSLSDTTGIFNGPNSVSIIASQIPEVDLPVEHQVLVWCSELVEVLATSVINMIDFGATPQDRKHRRDKLAHRELSRFSYSWPGPVNRLVESELTRWNEIATFDQKVVHFGVTIEANKTEAFLEIPHWDSIMTTFIACDSPKMMISICSAASCKPMPNTGMHAFSTRFGEPRSFAILENLNLMAGSRIKIQIPEKVKIQHRVWGTFFRNPISVRRHWESFDVDNAYLSILSIDHSLSTDLFYNVHIQPTDCLTTAGSHQSSFGLIASDNAGSIQSATVSENLLKEFRFYRTSTVTKKINFFIVLDAKCRYRITIEPSKLASMLSTLFHDFAIMPQILVATIFCLVAVQLIEYHGSKEPRQALPIHNVILKYIPEIVILCASMSIILPIVLDYRIPNRGPSSSVPLPTSQSLWSLFTICLVFLCILSIILEAISQPYITLRISLRLPIHHMVSLTSLLIAFLLVFPVYFLLSPTLYSIIVGIFAGIDFLSIRSRDDISRGFAMPRVLRCSWLMIHLGLLFSCIPMWSALYYPNPLTSLLHMIDFILFIFSNWSFYLGPYVLTPSHLQKVSPIAMLTFSMTLLLWAPRSIAIFPIITLFLWGLAVTSVAHMQKFPVEQKLEIFINQQNKIE